MFQRSGKTDALDLSFLRHGAELPECSRNKLFDRVDRKFHWKGKLLKSGWGGKPEKESEKVTK